jgi:5-methylcytosine-specific restriction endonuclease McrA
MLEKHPSQEKKIVSIFEKYNENDIAFRGVRQQTRYRQVNYVRHAYTVNNIVLEIWVPLKACISRMKKLKEFDYELTMKEAGSKEQRKLMSSELKNKIKIRDNYTCQICGKHMPDEVGLHIDHIIPVAKGGLSIEKNLRVLCSKCNGKKGSKIE